MKRPAQIPHIARRTAAGVVLAAAFLAAGCGSRHETTPGDRPDLPTIPVRVHPAESKSRETTEEVVGTVRSRLRATLEAKLSGRIEILPVALGEKVQAGQLVARLDAGEIKARYDQAAAGLDQAEREWKRVSTLFEQKGATQSEFDAAESRLRVARGAVAEAKAMLSYVEVVAPFQGVVTKKWVDAGDLATPGKPLVDIQDPSALQLDADVPEAVAASIRADAKLTVRVDTLRDALVGSVREIAPVADPASRTFRVKLDLPPAPGLMPGQFARLVVPVGRSQSVRVPVSAVVQRGQLEIVFVVTDLRARLHLVKSGERVGDEVEILSGLDSGDVVVVEGAAQLADGQPVDAR